MNHENIHISTEIIIDAPKEKVWKILSDLENWANWTSLMVSAEGEFKKDGNLTLEFVNPEGGSVSFERTMFLFDAENAFGWTGEAFAGLKDFHVFELELFENGSTKFIQSDGLHGADVPGLAEIEQQMLEGYKLFNRELKDYVENIA